MDFVNPTAFDAFAGDYDTDFTHSKLGRLLRPRVWEKLAQYFSPGQHVLELACGTGEDAVWLAQQGVRLTATDGSAEMVRQAQAKAEAAGVSNQIEVVQISLQEIGDPPTVRDSSSFVLRPLPVSSGRRTAVSGQLFDGVFSNFGGLNTIGRWGALAESLATIIRPGGTAILVPMGPFCPWEILWHAGHGQLQTAFRRWQNSAPAQIGEATIPIWYPSASRLRADFAPWFKHLHTESLGLWLPPSYLDQFVNRWPKFFAALNKVEKATARLTKSWGDHFIIIFQRRRG